MHLQATATALPPPNRLDVAYFADWLRGLDELRVGGMLSDEDYAMQRAERLEELLMRPRALWAGTLVAVLPISSIAATALWFITSDWYLVTIAASLACIFGLAMFRRPARNAVFALQMRSREEILRGLLLGGLLSAEEYLIYQDRLDHRK